MSPSVHADVVRNAKPSPSLWRATSAAPPINLVGAQMVEELRELLNAIAVDDRVAVIVFDSADPDYFLAHWDIAADQTAIDALPPRPTGKHLSWLPRLVGRGRALEILLGAHDFDADTAERYGYVNRSVPDVDDVTLPDDAEFPPQIAAFGRSVTRPETQDLVAQLFEGGFSNAAPPNTTSGPTWSV